MGNLSFENSRARSAGKSSQTQEGEKIGKGEKIGENAGEGNGGKSGYAELGKLRMYYEIHGEGGTPLVLIHGGGSTIPVTFGFTLGMFASDRMVIAVEMPAHGRTRDKGSRSRSGRMPIMWRRCWSIWGSGRRTCLGSAMGGIPR